MIISIYANYVNMVTMLAMLIMLTVVVSAKSPTTSHDLIGYFRLQELIKIRCHSSVVWHYIVLLQFETFQ